MVLFFKNKLNNGGFSFRFFLIFKCLIKEFVVWLWIIYLIGIIFSFFISILVLDSKFFIWVGILVFFNLVIMKWLNLLFIMFL